MNKHRGRDHTVDILIIGAGASGGAAAWSLSEAGFEVVCLEQGRWMNPRNYPTAGDDWEFRGFTDWSFDPNVRSRPEDYPVNNDGSPVSPLMFNAVGGSTIRWTAHAPRFHPSDFRVSTLDGIADDWPLSYGDLEPFYELNDRMMGCSGINGDPANPEREARQTSPLSLGPDGERLVAGFEKLGWHWWPSDSYILSEGYDGRQACNYCGPNGLGCTLRAKASTDITYWSRATDAGARVRVRCRVNEITVDDDGRATGANYYDRNGKLRHQAARAAIVAANGIGTPRLLLMSRSDAHPDGLANKSGLVGTHLMFHPYAIVTGVFDEELDSWRGPQGNILMSQQFYETDTKRDFLRGYTYQAVRSSGPAWVARGGFGETLPWGETHHEEFGRQYGKAISLAVIGEDLPEAHNTVTLDPALTDGNGLPAPKIDYTLSTNSRRLLDHGISNARAALKAAGAVDVIVNPLLENGGWHLMGTARMGVDPAASVVNEWGQTHDVDNLFIIDGSVFVTGAAVNPTPTIQALALRTAEYIANERSDLKASEAANLELESASEPEDALEAEAAAVSEGTAASEVAAAAEDAITTEIPDEETA